MKRFAADRKRLESISALLSQAASGLQAEGFSNEANALGKLIVHLNNLANPSEPLEVMQAKAKELQAIAEPLRYKINFTYNPHNKQHGKYEAIKDFWALTPEERENRRDNEANRFVGTYEEVKQWLEGVKLIGGF